LLGTKILRLSQSAWYLPNSEGIGSLTIDIYMTEQFKDGISIHSFSERILRSNSVTDQLERWCGEYMIGNGRLVALRTRNEPQEVIDDESLDILSTYKSHGKIRFRRVRLATAGLTLVDAMNWYFPDNLDSDICHKLETTDIPFGRAISHLNPRRRTFFVWRATPEQLVNRRGLIDPSSIAFEHRAVVCREDNVPLAVVHERFRSTLLLSAQVFVPAASHAAPVPGVARVRQT
jgi:chorismate-pyruvate lyase